MLIMVFRAQEIAGTNGFEGHSVQMDIEIRLFTGDTVWR